MCAETAERGSWSSIPGLERQAVQQNAGGGQTTLANVAGKQDAEQEDWRHNGCLLEDAKGAYERMKKRLTVNACLSSAQHDMVLCLTMLILPDSTLKKSMSQGLLAIKGAIFDG
jgi:hypothetical protein